MLVSALAFYRSGRPAPHPDPTPLLPAGEDLEVQVAHFVLFPPGIDRVGVEISAGAKVEEVVVQGAVHRVAADGPLGQ